MTQHGAFTGLSGYEEEDDLDEIPISNILFLDSAVSEGNNGNNVIFLNEEGEENQEECSDPLMIDPNVLPIGQDPLETFTLPPVVVEEPRKSRGKKTTRLEREKNVILSSTPSISLPSTPVVKWVPSILQPPKPKARAVGGQPGSQLKSMTFDEFTQEMERNIHDIVKESIGLFNRDPREYHPVYLRIYKYVTIGQRLGYIATDEAYVKSVWTGFFKFADAQHLASKRKTMVFSGEKSAYATYLLTRKVIINGKVIAEKRNDTERQKMFKELEATAKRIRNEWDAFNSPSDQIRDDLSVRLKFFKECMIVTHPADCLKMNNLWTKFLSEEGFSRRKSGGLNRNTSLTRIAPKVKPEVPLITIPSDEETETNNEEEEEEKSRQSLRRIIKVIVAPSFSCLDSQTLNPAMPPASRSPSPPCSPGGAPSPPCSPAAPSIHSPPPSPVPASSPQPSSSIPIIETEFSSTNSPEKTNKKSPNVSLKKVKSKLIQGKGVKRKAVKKLCPTTTAVKKACPLTNKLKRPMMTASSILKKKRKLFTGMATSKTNNNDASRQLKLEKMITQGKSKLLSGVVRKKPVIKTNETPQPSEASNVKVNTAIATKKRVKLKKRKVGKTTNASTLKKQTPSKTTSLSERLRKKRALLEVNKKKRNEKVQKRLEKMICQKKSTKADETKLMEGEVDETKLEGREAELQKKREVFSLYSKYGQLKTKCPIASCRIETRLNKLSFHLKVDHKIDEYGKTWPCPVCAKDFILRRDSWLGHIDREHGNEVNMEEMVKNARKVHPDVEVTEETSESNEPDGYVSLPESLPLNKISIQSSSNTTIEFPAKPIDFDSFRKEKPRGRGNPKRNARVVCDECGEYFLFSSLASHKLRKHSANRLTCKCPVCKKEFMDGRFVWIHYCENHLKGHPLEILDPVSKGMPMPPEVTPFPRERKNKDPVAISTVCSVCGRNFVSFHSLKRHMFHIHGIGERKEENLECQYCQKVFKTKEALVAHVKRLHEGKVKSKCPTCSNDLQTPGKLWRHMIDKHGESAFDAAAYCEITFIPCPYCGLELLSKGKQLNNHVRTQHPESFEEFTFSQLSEKVVQNDDGKETNGPRLPTHTQYSSMLLEVRKLKKREMRRRWREEGVGPAWIQRENSGYRHDAPGDCTVCGKHFQRLKAHMRKVHEIKGDQRQVQCTVEGCASVLNSYRTLKHHIRTHHTTDLNRTIVESKVVKIVEETETCTSYLCTLCKENLYHFEEVKVHIVASHPHILANLIGSDNIPPPLVPPRPPPQLPCPHCPLTFNGDENVRSHVEQFHMDLCWRCPECSKVMLSPDDFEKHFGEEHSGEKKKENEKEKDIELKVFVKLGGRKKICSRPRGPRRPNADPKELKLVRRKWVEKFCKVKIQCEICGQETRIGTLTGHLQRIHWLKENEEPIYCKLCPTQIPFNLYKPMARSHFLYHQERYHSKEVDMEEMIKMMSKVHTKEDWRTMDIKNPNGRSTREGESDDEELASEKKRIRRRRKRGTNCKSKMDFTKVQCEICKRQILIQNLWGHLKKVHGVQEEPLCCKLCPITFDIQMFGGRSKCLCHMEQTHGTEVDMQEMIEWVSKVHTKEDWKTMDIKNPDGVRLRNKKGVKRKRVTKKKDESEEDEQISETESDELDNDKSDWEESEKKSKSLVKKESRTKHCKRTRKSDRQPVIPVRASGRTRVKPVKYSEFFNEDDEDSSDKEETNVKRSVSTKRVESTKVKKSNASNSLAETIEQEKKLIITVTRLTEEELSMHCYRRQQEPNEVVQTVVKLEREREDEATIVENEDPLSL